MDMNIICTINECWTESDIEEMTYRGLNEFRINGVHLSKDNIVKYVNFIKRHNTNKIYFDLPGRKARLWYEKEKQMVKKGTIINIWFGEQNNNVYMTGYEEFANAKESDILCVRRNDRDNVYLKVLSRDKKKIKVELQNDGVLGWGYQVYNISHFIQGSGIAKDDEYYIDLIKDLDVDYVVVSFVDNVKMFLEYKKRILKNNPNTIIYAKIETEEGIKNATEIMSVCQGVVVGRDDMSMFYNETEIQENVERLLNLGEELNRIVIPASNYFKSLECGNALVEREIANIVELKRKNVTKIYCNETSKYNQWKVIADLKVYLNNKC